MEGLPRQKTMIWANNALPVFMPVSGAKPEIPRERSIRYQIGDTPCRSEMIVMHGFQRFTNRAPLPDRASLHVCECR